MIILLISLYPSENLILSNKNTQVKKKKKLWRRFITNKQGPFMGENIKPGHIYR